MIKYKSIKTIQKSKIFIDEGGKRIKRSNKNFKNFKPLLTIITVVKNSSKNIEKTIKSVANQPYKNIEHIIIDGNSDDSTLNIIKKFEKKVEYWCSIDDKGIYDAMNYGIKLSKGNFIGILNAGDIYTLKAFKIIRKYLNRDKKLSFLFGTVKRYYLNNNLIVKSGFDRNRINYNFDSQSCHSSGFFIQSHIQRNIGLYNLKYKCSSDYDLFYKLFKNKKLIGDSTKKYEVIGIVGSGGFSSKFGFWNHLIEESRIRLDNKQNKIIILVIFLNTIIKNYIKKLLLK